MAQHHTLPLQLSEETEKQLLRQYNAFVHQLENGRPLQPQLLDSLRAAMLTALEAQPGFPEWRADAQLNHHLLHLTHPGNELLNLPWRLAVEDTLFLYLTKGLPAGGALPAYLPDNALPLKVLVMIASPEDDSARLSYEEEEDKIIRAFQPLYEHGQVQIDFTEDGSLPGLKRKLRENHYHILHFSGHGIFKGGEGWLQLEDEITMRKVQVSGLEFAQALNAHPEHRPALVLLSSCQTAQGRATDEFKGIANQLLRAGVPAVVAMGLSVLDYFATAFAGHFYRQLAEKEPLHRAFRSAIEFIRHEEARLRPDAAPGQWMIPQLYCSQRCEQVVDWQKPFTPLQFSNL
ncbi:MAG: CHAT domain-containing protein, partial [Phaeodactylibacter sp.]|nr:CHAT domain-containing protein [Phaeodactylibacter sp.]